MPGTVVSHSRRAMSAAQVAAIFLTSSRERVPNGCGITAIGKSGDPSAFCCARPRPMKLCEQTVSAALARFATSTLSWILHDVQDPQSPEPVITASTCPTNSFITSAGAPCEALFLRRLTTLHGWAAASCRYVFAMGSCGVLCCTCLAHRTGL